MFSVFTTLPYCSYSFIISFFLILISLSYFSLFSFHIYFFSIFSSLSNLLEYFLSHMFCFSYFVAMTSMNTDILTSMSVFYFITYVADCCNICVAHDWAISCAMFTDLFNLYIVFVSPAKCCLVI